MSLEYRVGDVFDRLAEIPDGTIDLIVTSPPFLALRSYLPEGHPDKAKEIGSEPSPAEFIDTLLALSAEWGRVLAPHGSLCVELGDTYSGAGGYGSPDAPNPAYGAKRAVERQGGKSRKRFKTKDDGWPLAKSLTGIPTIYPWSLAYGRNLLTGQTSPAGLWRIRNMIVWARPNPPVGALGDKFRPATSYITVACKSAKRYFDLDAVRTEHAYPDDNRHERPDVSLNAKGLRMRNSAINPAGAPPLDWHADDHPEDGDWLWKMSTQPYKGSHYATYPLKLPTRLIEAMCPLKVCQTCGVPSTRIVDVGYTQTQATNNPTERGDIGGVNGAGSDPTFTHGRANKNVETLGFTDCGHDNYRTGVVLDPFGGSGTTAQAAQNVGRHAILIDLDERNAQLAQSRVGMFLDVT